MESDTLSCISTLTTDTTEDDVSAERYGKLLLCPVCDQLLTHPVLLPCQHSVCYGCARSQILAQEIEDQSSQCETPTQNKRNKSASTNSTGKLTRRMTPSGSLSTPQNCNLNNGNAASPSLSVRSSSSLSESSHGMSLSTKDAGYESSLSENQMTFATKKKKSHISHTRGVLPKFYSSPKRSNSLSSARRLNSSKSTSLISPKCYNNETSELIQCNASPQALDDTIGSDVSCRSIISETSYVQKPDNESPTLAHLRQSSRTSPRDVTCCESSFSGMRRSTSASIVTGRFSFRSNQRIDSNVLKKSKVSSLFCPTCEGCVPLGKLGIKGLFRNFALESIVDRYRTAARAVEAIRCGYCKPPASDATRSCLDCKLSYCNQCYKAVHIWGTKKAQHEFVGPTSNFSRPKVMLCPEHGNEAITMYCNQCQHSVCKICKSRGTHAKHQTISVKNAYKKSKARLNTLLDELKHKEVETRTEILQLEDDVRKLESEEADARDEIHSAVDEMHKLLETKRTELLGSVDTAARSKEKELRRRLQDVKDDVLYSSVMAFAEEVLLETDPAYFLQTFKMIETRTREAIDHMSKNHCKSDNAVDISPFRELFYAEQGTKLRSLLPIYIDLKKLKKCIQKWDVLQVPDTPVYTDGDASYNVESSSLPKSKDPTWQLTEHNAVADYFQISYLNEASDSVEIESHPNGEEEFRITTSSKILSNSNNTNVRVRAANKAGVGPWSEPSVASPRFLKREHFKMIRLQSREMFDIVHKDDTVKLTNSQDTKSGTEFITYKGDIKINIPGKYYWEIEATGAPEFAFFVGIADTNSSELTDTLKYTENTSLAAFFVGPRSCGVVNFSDEKLSDSKFSKLPKRISSFKPLKKLKHSLLRHSGLTLSMGDLRPKNVKRKESNSDDASITSGSTISRSPSVTSLPSVLQSKRSTNPTGTSWNMRRFVGRRYFRIGVDLELFEDSTVDILFLDLTDTTGTVLGKRTIHCEYIEPVFAISKNGDIKLV